MRYEKAVILGAAGFIGINLSHALARQGVRLVCFDRIISPHWPEAATPVIGDFGHLPQALLKQLDHAMVFHLVSSSRPQPSTAEAAGEVGRDLVTTIQYLEATRERDIRWIFFSSGGTVYGQNDDMTIRESQPTHPICSYGVVKLAMEKYFALYRRLHGIDYVTVRLANPYGPWQHPLKGQGIIAAMLYRAMKGETIEIWGDGSKVRDYIYIGDAVKGVLSAAGAGRSGETYNIGTSRGMSINQLVDVIAGVQGTAPKVRYTAERSVDVARNVLSIEKLFTHTGWRPKTEIDDGIAMTADWLSKNSRLW